MKGWIGKSNRNIGKKVRMLVVSVAIVFLAIPLLAALGQILMPGFVGASSYPADPFEYPDLLDEPDEEEDDEVDNDDPDEDPPRFIKRYDFEYVSASEIRDIVGNLGIDVQTVIFPTNAYTMWVRGTEENHDRLSEFISEADNPENEMALDYQLIPTRYITPDRAVQLLEESGVTLDRYFNYGRNLVVFDADALARWDEIVSLIRGFDSPRGQEEVVFTYESDNLSARETADLLQSIGLDGVRVEEFNHSELGTEIIIICPPDMQHRVESVLSTLDGDRKTIRAPLLTVQGEDARAELSAIRSLLSELSGISRTRMTISENISGDSDNPKRVLWVEETPENVTLLEELLNQIN